MESGVLKAYKMSFGRKMLKILEHGSRSRRKVNLGYERGFLPWFQAFWPEFSVFPGGRLVPATPPVLVEVSQSKALEEEVGGISSSSGAFFYRKKKGGGKG